jgi:hypothetical protein
VLCVQVIFHDVLDSYTNSSDVECRWVPIATGQRRGSSLILGFGSVFIWYGSGSGPSILGWKLIWIQGFDDQKLEKIYSWKKITFFGDQKLQLTYLALGLHKGRPIYRRSLQISKENIQHFKTWNFLIFFYFCGSFFPSWIRIRIHWPDWILIHYGSGSETLVDFNMDQDPAFYHNVDPDPEVRSQTNADSDSGQTLLSQRYCKMPSPSKQTPFFGPKCSNRFLRFKSLEYR